MPSLEQIFSVSELVEAINFHLGLLNQICLEGEISRIQIRQNTLIFLTVKDDKSALDVFALTRDISNFHQLEDGMKVKIYGTAGLYKGSGRFRIHAHTIIPSGEGALKLAYEKLKLQLEQEGLFDESRKRPLPQFPQTIGLITAKDSQAYQDFVKVSSQRMGGLHIKFMPTTVQGVQAVPSILKSLKYFNHLKNCHTLVITRGGGSLEDLMAFNDEKVVRAIFASPIPTVCAIGHESDWTLAEMAADQRASTPSNAAELTVKDKHQVTESINHSIITINHLVKDRLKTHHRFIDQSLLTLNRQLNHQISNLQNLNHRLISSFQKHLQQIATDQNQLITNLSHHGQTFFTHHQNKIDHFTSLLQTINPQRLLQRGYSITTDSTGRAIKDIKGLSPNQPITTQLSNGTIQSLVTKLLPSSN